MLISTAKSNTLYQYNNSVYRRRLIIREESRPASWAWRTSWWGCWLHSYYYWTWHYSDRRMLQLYATSSANPADYCHCCYM